MLRIAVVTVAFAGIATADVMVLVGTGNCDGDDHSCVEGPAAQEQVIRPLLVKTDGSMSVPQNTDSIPTGGSPVWLTTCGNSIRDGCLFATLADKSAIFSYGTRGDGPPVKHSVASGGLNPVFASVTEDGSTLLVANYNGPDDTSTSSGASVASFQIGADCSLTLADVKHHSGSSINPSRQGGAHVHSVVAAREGLAYACDLGMDVIFTYEVASDGQLTEVHRTPVELGVGPRHLVQHPSLPYLYVVTEMGQSVLVYKQADKGVLELLQTFSLGHVAGNKAGEIAISPDGSLVFATNRGLQNKVHSFKTDRNGNLEQMLVLDAPSYPRGMALVDDGATLLIGGQSKTEVWSYRVGQGKNFKLLSELHPTGSSIDLPPHPATFTSFSAYSPGRLPRVKALIEKTRENGNIEVQDRMEDRAAAALFAKTGVASHFNVGAVLLVGSLALIGAVAGAFATRSHRQARQVQNAWAAESATELTTQEVA